MRAPLAALGLLCLATNQAVAQRVLIRNTTPAVVAESLTTYLLPEGFQLVTRDEKGVSLNLDRGMIPQSGTFNRTTHTNLFHVVMELHFRFKQKSTACRLAPSKRRSATTTWGRPSAVPFQAVWSSKTCNACWTR